MNVWMYDYDYVYDYDIIYVCVVWNVLYGTSTYYIQTTLEYIYILHVHVVKYTGYVYLVRVQNKSGAPFLVGMHTKRLFLTADTS